MDVIKIRGLEVKACHGVHGFEKMNAQKFVFDIDAETDFFNAAVSDSLADTISYSDICAFVVTVAKNSSYNLIEKLAYECAIGLCEKFPQINGVNLTVYKPEAPVKHSFSNIGVGVSVTREKVYLSLGSSLGDRKAALDAGIKKLGELRGTAVERVSSYIATAPYGGVAENEFLNCAVSISTVLSPQALLDEIHRIEKECGRVREKRWGDRTLDIDIVFFGDKKISGETLTVPHREYKKRDFVKIPLKEIAPWLDL